MGFHLHVLVVAVSVAFVAFAVVFLVVFVVGYSIRPIVSTIPMRITIDSCHNRHATRRNTCVIWVCIGEPFLLPLWLPWLDPNDVFSNTIVPMPYTPFRLMETLVPSFEFEFEWHSSNVSLP